MEIMALFQILRRANFILETAPQESDDNHYTVQMTWIDW